MALLIIAEFIIIYSTRLDKWNLVPGLLALLLIFNAFRSLLQRIPKVLGALWHRHLIAYQSSSQFEIESNDINQNPVHDLETEYSKFVDEFRERLNRRSQWLLGLISSIGGYAMASMSLSEEMQYNHLIINLILGSFIGLVIGLMAWRMAVITYMVGEMGRRFDLNIQFGNPDKCGGLEPLGNLCFWNSLVLSIPSIYLTLGILVLFDFSQYSWYDSEIAKKLIENAIFVIPTMIVIINFIFSQLSIHKIMLSKRDNEWQNLSNQFDLLDKISRETYQQEINQKKAEQMEKLELLQKIYISKRDLTYATWPFNFGILAKFVTGITIVIFPMILNIKELLNI